MESQLVTNSREKTKVGGDEECRGGSELLFLVGLNRDGFPETARFAEVFKEFGTGGGAMLASGGKHSRPSGQSVQRPWGRKPCQ